MFLTRNTTNFHVQYPDVTRHWSPRSEKFAGADSLVTAMMRGWDINDEVVCERIAQGPARMVNVYHFRMRKDDREITMPVLENPYVTRLLFTSPFDVIEMEDAENDAAS
jgi:hypothetical protein